MAENEYPKWIESPDSTPEERKGVAVQDAIEEKALLDKTGRSMNPTDERKRLDRAKSILGIADGTLGPEDLDYESKPSGWKPKPEAKPAGPSPPPPNK